MELEVFCRRRKTIKPRLGAHLNLITLESSEPEPDLLLEWNTRGEKEVGLVEPSALENKYGTERPVNYEDSGTEEDPHDEGSHEGDMHQDSFVFQVDIGNGPDSQERTETETETDAKLSVVNII